MLLSFFAIAAHLNDAYRRTILLNNIVESRLHEETTEVRILTKFS